MSSPSDAEVIGRSLGEPEVFGLLYDRHAATLLRFQGRQAGARVEEALVGELFRIAFVDLEGHRWRFQQRLGAVPPPEPRSRPGGDSLAR